MYYHSHVLQVPTVSEKHYVPEKVLDIDEETRMGPEISEPGGTCDKPPHPDQGMCITIVNNRFKGILNSSLNTTHF